MDFTVIRQSARMPFCLVMIDNFSRWMVALPCANQTGAVSVKGFRRIVEMFGVPEEIVTDAGTHFTCREFVTALEELGVRHSVCTPYAKRSNGLVERANRTLQDTLSKNLPSNNRNLDAWYLYVQDSVLAYNVTPHDGLASLTPYEVMYGSKYCARGDDVEVNPASEDYWKGVRDRITRVQNVRSGYYKSNVTEIRYKAGDKVFVCDRSKMAQRMLKIDLPNSVKATVVVIGRRSAQIQEDGKAGKLRAVPIAMLQPRFD